MQYNLKTKKEEELEMLLQEREELLQLFKGLTITVWATAALFIVMNIIS